MTESIDDEMTPTSDLEAHLDNLKSMLDIIENGDVREDYECATAIQSNDVICRLLHMEITDVESKIRWAKSDVQQFLYAKACAKHLRGVN